MVATVNLKEQKLVTALLNWFSANARDLPWRRTRDPYAIWVSEIMLQQTQVKTVIPYWERWLRALPTAEAAANASSERIHKLWEGLGYYTRARNLQQAAKQIVARHGGKFPQKYDDVLALPGIGRYTAGAICSIAFNQPTPILDGNVIRVLTRIFGIAENPKEKETNARLWHLAEKLVLLAKVQNPPVKGRDSARRCPDAAARRPYQNLTHHYCSFLNQSLMELGALVCTPRNPQCRICPVKQLCIAFRKNRVNELPNLGKREAATTRRFVAFVAGRNGRFLVRQRPAGVVNAHLWEFPNVEILNGKCNPKLAAKNIFGVEPSRLQPLCTIKHSITRYRITLEAFHVRLGGTSYTSPRSKPARSGARVTRPAEIGIWKTPAQLHQLPFSSAHKQILNQLPAALK
jgi:A/G-specific adenine glycosylase